GGPGVLQRLLTRRAVCEGSHRRGDGFVLVGAGGPGPGHVVEVGFASGVGLRYAFAEEGVVGGAACGAVVQGLDALASASAAIGPEIVARARLGRLAPQGVSRAGLLVGVRLPAERDVRAPLRP